MCSCSKKNHSTLPKTRTTIAEKLCCFIIFIVVLSTYFYEKNFILYIGTTFGINVLCYTLFECVYRVCLFCEEFRHLTSRYNDSTFLLIKEVFFTWGNWQYPIYAAVICLLVVGGRKNHDTFINIYFGFDNILILGSWMCLFLLWKVLKADRTGFVYDSLAVDQLQLLGYASGMATSFFNGYLNIVLPKTGKDEKHDLVHRMDVYEGRENIKFATKKLFILLPLSMHCPVSLEDCTKSELNHFVLIKDSKSLDSFYITRAGVKDREYKNAVYKLKKEGSYPIYICAEYASPLLTFKESLSVHDNKVYLRRFVPQLVLQFYLTLKQILEDRKEFEGLYDLIFYDDETTEVANLILSRLETETK